MRTLILLIALVGALSGQLSWAQPGGNKFILNTLHSSLVPQEAWTPPEGAWAFGAETSVTNTFLKNPVYTIDVEQWDLDLTLGHAVTDALFLQVNLPLRWRGGGVFDHTIRQWHEWFDLPEADRQLVENDQYLVEGETTKGPFALRDRGSGLGNLQLSALMRLRNGTRGDGGWQESLSVTLGLPTASDGFGQDSVDAVLAYLYGTSRGSWKWHMGVGGIFIQDRFEQGLRYRPVTPQGFGTIGYALTERFELFLSASGGMQTLVHIGRLPEWFIYLDTGVRWTPSSQIQCGLSLRENPYPSRASADVSLSFGCERTWH